MRCQSIYISNAFIKSECENIKNNVSSPTAKNAKSIAKSKTTKAIVAVESNNLNTQYFIYTSLNL